MEDAKELIYQVKAELAKAERDRMICAERQKLTGLFSVLAFIVSIMSSFFTNGAMFVNIFTTLGLILVITWLVLKLVYRELDAHDKYIDQLLELIADLKLRKVRKTADLVKTGLKTVKTVKKFLGK